MSFVMMMTILLCGDAEGGIFDAGAIRIGAIVGLEVMLFVPISGAAMSPARIRPVSRLGRLADLLDLCGGAVRGDHGSGDRVA